MNRDRSPVSAASVSGGCPDPQDDPGAPFPSTFRWHVQPGYLGADGVRVLLEGELAGHGTYRLAPSNATDYVIDVPQGMEIIRLGGAQGDRPEDTGTSIALEDAASGSILSFDTDTGEERGRRVVAHATLPGPNGIALPADGALFDQIVESTRRVEPVPVGLAALEEIQGTCSAPHAVYVWVIIDRLLRLHQDLVALLALQEGPVLDVAAIRAQIVRVAEGTAAAVSPETPPGLHDVWDATYRALAWLNGANSDFLKVLERDPLSATLGWEHNEEYYYVDGLQRFQAHFARAGQLLGDYCAAPAGAATTAADLFGGTDVAIVWQYHRVTRAKDRSYLAALGTGDFPIAGGDVLWVVSPVGRRCP